MAEDEITSLLTLISHELRAPVGVAQGYLRMLQPRPVSDVQEQAIAAALRACEQSMTLLHQLSALARLRQGETTWRRLQIPLHDLLNRSAAAVGQRCDRSVAIAIDNPPQVAVWVDEPAMTQALASLVFCVQRAQRDGSTLRVMASLSGVQDRQGVTIAVTTTGHEGPDTDAPLDTTRGGMGLELPIADTIVRAHDGHVRERRRGRTLTGMVVWVPVGAGGTGGG
jgi:signal transduction histidine kinase